MRRSLRALALVLSLCQTVSAQQNATALPQLRAALTGDWVGVLEYRDYSEPAGSTKRVQLPTWLSITGAASLTWQYVYDDGPGKVVTETDVVTLDPAAGTLISVDNGKPAKTFTVQGYAELKDGRGALILLGSGTDAGKPADLKETMTIRRNLLEVLEETRPTGSSESFTFRHVYRFVRKDVPAVTGSKERP